MGAPTSSILSEMYLQFVEHTAIYKVLIRNNILRYFRYVDDILIAYNGSITDIEEVLNSFNSLVPTMKFTMENEIDITINFLDITIQKGIENLSFDIYRKPITTDTIIPSDSCHQPEHKHAAIRYLVNRMNRYSLSDSSKEVENNILKHILRNNKYDVSILEKVSKTKPKMQKKKVIPISGPSSPI